MECTIVRAAFHKLFFSPQSQIDDTDIFFGRRRYDSHCQFITPYIYKHVLKKVDCRNPAGWCGFIITGKRQSMKENVGAVPRGGGGGPWWWE
ncbi:hypothetical protein ALC56_13924 [Trachymyrmex septentrionalis]|uniref:Uncharacterized protein n=1 Tax=Trachymyrmex septentrionalis TaxID=34720 RepID=A0A195EU57_9HYME|nr:hypothetical protein ALC56_13924 [Trachymyrmex septentrionalis]